MVFRRLLGRLLSGSSYAHCQGYAFLVGFRFQASQRRQEMAILRTLLAFLRALLASRACLVAESLTLAAWSAVLFTSESRWCHRALTAPDGQALAPRPGGDHPGLSPIGDGSPFKCQKGEPNNGLGRYTMLFTS